MADPPTAQEFFATEAAPATAPTGADFFNNAQPQSGAAHDSFWSSMTEAGARILSSTGNGAADAWGDKPLGSWLTEPLSKAGVLPAYKDSNTEWSKTLNEALLRPAIDAAKFADFESRGFGIPAAAAGLGGGLTQTGEEIEGAHPTGVQGLAAYPFKAAGELSYGFAEGAFLGELGEGVGRSPEMERAHTAAAARATGVVGEGEAGFYGAEPITPENLEVRTAAAQEAGVTAPPPEPPPPDIHALARRIDPETFQEYDALAAERALHSAEIARLGQERENSPEALQAQEQIDTILGKVGGVEARLTKAAGRLADAQERLDAALSTDTEEMAAARERLMDADFAMRDLALEVSSAYRAARDIAPPDLPEEVPNARAPTGEIIPEQERPVEAEGGPQTPEEGQAHVSAPVAAEAAGGTAEGQATTVNVVQGRAPPRGAMRAVEGTGEETTRGLSEGVEEKAIEDGLTKGFGDLPEYRRLSMADQAARVTAFMNEDYERAKRVAMGDLQPPEGVLPESVFVGVEKRALAEGDVETLRQLATRSRLNSAATTMGQRIRTLGERDANSPVGHIQEVQTAREAAFKGDIVAEKAKAVSEIKAEVAKAASKADAWADFLSVIKCGEG